MTIDMQNANVPTDPRLKEVKVGDTVYRYLAGTVEMEMLVLEVNEKLIRCTAKEIADRAAAANPDKRVNFEAQGLVWDFDRKSGAEIDDDLEWGPEYGQTGSYITVERKQ